MTSVSKLRKLANLENLCIALFMHRFTACKTESQIDNHKNVRINNIHSSDAWFS